MAVIRVNKSKDFTVMSNTHFREREMSLKAKGLLSLMLSLPDDWNYSVEGLTVICKENETAIKSTLDELKQFGYLTVVKKFPNETKSGRFEYEYNVYEQPQGKQAVEKQGIENLPLEFLQVENQGQYNTNLPNTEESKTKGIKKERKSKPSTYDDILSDIEDSELRELYLEYIKMRKLIKAPMTDRALQILITKVNQLEPNDVSRQKRLLEQSIANNWKSVYPLKDEAPQKGAPGFDLDEFFNAAVLDAERKSIENPPKTAAEDEGIRKRAEALKKGLSEW